MTGQARDEEEMEGDLTINFVMRLPDFFLLYGTISTYKMKTWDIMSEILSKRTVFEL